jgi:hypothetical protein
MDGWEVRDRQREARRSRYREVLRGCGLEDVDLIMFTSHDDLSSVSVLYGGDLTFEILQKISAALGTTKIDLSCDSGTGSDPCHYRELAICGIVLKEESSEVPVTRTE